jgi:putative ABC transport system permease protein
MSIEGRPQPARGEELVAHYQYVTPDYFKAIGVPLVRGRWLSTAATADRDTLGPVALINQQMVHRAFGGVDPIGKRIKFGDFTSRDPWVTVVGVVGDFRHYRLPQPMGPAIYYPYANLPMLTQTLAVRTRLGDPLALVPSVRAIIRELDTDVPAYQVRTLEQQVSRALWRQRLQGEVLGVFAVLALLLASVGLYGVISYAVAQRTRELGVRVALGATRRDVLAMVLAQGMRLTLVGVFVGIISALALSRIIASLLHGVGPTDLFTFVIVPLVLVVVSLVASYVPARRATHVDPLLAMRTE